MTYTFDAELWEHSGEAPWVFVTLPREESDDIADATDWRPGFGSVKVSVVLGATSWSTSLFPSSERSAYVLPVKRAVREKEGVDIGDVVSLTIEVVGA